MTEEQYREAREKVNKYFEIQGDIGRLKNEKKKLDDYGVVEIVSEDLAGCEWKVKSIDRHEGFQGRLTDSILQFYDSEIERLQKQLEEL